MTSELDTDSLLAIVASLVEDVGVADTDILEALADSDGDPYAAAQKLKGRAISSADSKSLGKRKRGNTIEAWLKPKTRKDKDMAVASSSKNASGSPPGPSLSPKKPVFNLMDILKQPPPDPKLMGPPKLPPLTLSSPALVAEHSPCTLHLSVLPPDLACRLFYAMLQEAKSWRRNKWWLFDRVVESPHRTSFYTRAHHEKEDEKTWADVARAWLVHLNLNFPSSFKTRHQV